MTSIDMLLEPVRAMLAQAGVFAPRLVLAALLLLGGWLLAKVLRAGLERSLRLINLNVLSQRSGLDAFLVQSGLPYDGPGLFGLLLYWAVLMIAFMSAFGVLGMPQLAELLRDALFLVPRFALALIIVLLGGYFARFVRERIEAFCATAEVADGMLLGRIAHYAIVVLVVLIALDFAHLVSDLARTAFLIVLAGVTLALALAFGLGARERAAELIERWWPRPRPEAPRMRAQL